MAQTKRHIKRQVTKYLEGKARGLTKTEAKELAGYAPTTSVTQIEDSQTYKEIAPKFKDALLSHIDMEEIASALIDNIRQTGEDKIDRGARNKAIEIAVNKIEPSELEQKEEEKVLIVMAKKSKGQIVLES